MDKLNGLSPKVEFGYLRNSAVGLAVMGLMFVFFAIESFFLPSLEENPWLNIFMLIPVIGGVAFMIFNAFNTSVLSVNRQSFLFGNYRDEYLHYVNSKGNKYALASAAIFLFSSFFFAESLIIDQAIISFKDYIFLNGGVIILTYAITVLCLLRGEHD